MFPCALRPASPVNALHNDRAVINTQQLTVVQCYPHYLIPSVFSTNVLSLVKNQLQDPTLHLVVTSFQRLPSRRFLTFSLCFILGQLPKVLVSYFVERPSRSNCGLCVFSKSTGEVRPCPSQPITSGPWRPRVCKNSGDADLDHVLQVVSAVSPLGSDPFPFTSEYLEGDTALSCRAYESPSLNEGVGNGSPSGWTPVRRCSVISDESRLGTQGLPDTSGSSSLTKSIKPKAMSYGSHLENIPKKRRPLFGYICQNC